MSKGMNTNEVQVALRELLRDMQVPLDQREIFYNALFGVVMSHALYVERKTEGRIRNAKV